jgi:hypothetical protein
MDNHKIPVIGIGLSEFVTGTAIQIEESRCFT